MDKYFEALDRVALEEGYMAARDDRPVNAPRLQRRLRKELIRLFQCKAEANYIIRTWRAQRTREDFSVTH